MMFNRPSGTVLDMLMFSQELIPGLNPYGPSGTFQSRNFTTIENGFKRFI